jgi:hypothetical protein
MATGDVHTSTDDGRSTRSKEAIALPQEHQGGAGSRAGDGKEARGRALHRSHADAWMTLGVILPRPIPSATGLL